VTIRSRWLAPPANFRASVRIRSFAFLAKPSKAHDVIRKITCRRLICALALAVHFYAHHNWHPLPPGTTIDRVVVEKAVRKLYRSFRDGRRLKSYRVRWVAAPIGPKEKEAT